jgi:hypothetical protein
VTIFQRVPDLQIDVEIEEGRLLVPAGKLVVFGDFVEAERFVHGRQRKLGRIKPA